MKRLIIFLLLFAAIKVAGQTTGYLRFDTVKIMKQNGTCELYIINKTKDSTGGVLTNIGGGLTSFRKTHVSGDTLFVGGDTVIISGTGKLDSVTIETATDPDPDSLFEWRGPTRSFVGLIPKGGGASGQLTTITEGPVYVKAGDSALNIPDTLAVRYDTTTIGIRTTGVNDSALTVNTTNISTVQRLNDTAAAIRADFPTGSALTLDLGASAKNRPLSETKITIAGKGTAGADTVTNHSYTSVDSTLAYFSTTRIGASGFEYGGVLFNGTSGDTLWLWAPYGILFGDSQAEGHPGRHGREHANGANTFSWEYPDSTGQISYHLRALTKMRWYNQGIGGQTTAQMRARFYRDVLASFSPGTSLFATRTLLRKPHTVVIIGGINDVFNGMTIEQTKENLIWMAKVCQQEGIRCVMLNLPGDAISGQTQLRKIADINEWFASGELDQYDVSVVDYNTWWNDPTYGNDNVHPTSLIVDDIHPSMVGYDSLANYIFREAKLPVLTQATFYMELSPAGFTGYSRPTDITLSGTSYVLSGSTSTINITQYVPDSAYIRIDASTNITGTSFTGFNHVAWFLDNNPTNIDYYTRRTHYNSGDDKSLMSSIRMFAPWSMTSGDRYNILDIRHNDSTYKTLTHVQSGADGITYLNYGTAALTPIITGATLNVTGGIASSSNFTSISGTSHRFGQAQITTNLAASTTGYGISFNNGTTSAARINITGKSNGVSLLLDTWNGSDSISAGAISGTVMEHFRINLGASNAGNTNQTVNVISNRPVWAQRATANSTGTKYRGYYYNPIELALVNVQHDAILTVRGDVRFNAVAGSTAIGLDSATTIGAKLHVVGTIRNDGMPVGVVTDNIVVHGTDSLLKQIPASSFATQSALNDTAAAIRADFPAGGGISGSGTSGRVTFWNGASSVTSDANLLYSTSDAGTLSIGTTNTQGHLNIGGNKDLGSSGVQSYFAGATYTDNVTAASGTSSSWVINLIGIPTIAATNSSVSVPSATTLLVEPPAAGTNVTFSTPPFSIISNGATYLSQGVKRNFSGIANGTTNIDYTRDIIQCNATSGNVTATLPNSTIYSGFTFTFIRVDGSGNTVTINTTSSQTINGNASYSLAAQYNRLTVVSDGSNWLIIESN